MFTTYPVTKKLQPYVSFYYDLNWERKDYENDIRETVLPSGKGFMVFQYKGRFRGMMDNEEQFVPKYYTIGQQTKTYTLFSDHETNSLTGVAFKPTGLYHMFGQNMALLANSTMDSKTVLGSDLTHFEISYEKESRTEMKVNMVEGLLLNQLEDKKYVPSFIDISIDMMNRSLGCEPITKITKKLNVSERYFQKKFKEMVGITPSEYNRIVRFNNLFSQFDAEDQNNYKTLVALFNYYDLAHFSKDFKKYCGETPKKFHLDKFKFVKEAFIKNPIFLK